VRRAAADGEGAGDRSAARLAARILPAEAGLDETHISFTKGCYLGQEPIARQRYRGKVNRRLRVLDVEGEATPGTELLYEDKKVTRRFRRKFVRQRGRAKPGLSV
jgi:folate-binding protein YgfZ